VKRTSRLQFGKEEISIRIPAGQSHSLLEPRSAPAFSNPSFEVEDLVWLKGRSSKPLLCGALDGEYSQRMAGAIEARGIPVFSQVRQWLPAARALSFRISQKRRTP
jgi:hypothetical protein